MDQASQFVIASRAALAQLSALAVQYSFSVIGAIIIFIAGWLLSGLLSRWSREGLNKIHGIDITLAQFLANVIRYAVMVIVVVMVLGQFGVQTASILAALGAAGLAIGLALQGTLQNIAAGIMLLVLRPFRVGEYIDAGNVSGTVLDIGLFATELKTGDGIYRMAPNSTLWNVPITNYSRLPTRMYDLTIGIDYTDDIETAEKVLLDLAKADERVMQNPAPTVFVAELAASSVNLTLRFWARSDVWWATTRDLTKAAKTALSRNGLHIPYPQMTYHQAGDAAPPKPAPKGPQEGPKPD
ncbi:mechanosensitive ion channel family protein [Rhizobium oryzicola]|uniref:Small-conductance mechanosensitive channel n=1 Tax=Rhizobium oryzicola TaxID=1232668 RepID=A0ABT8ST99_9HYPH|nr:mechanosensitive ion channel domain-containing protein [Rhizobium oryzicola]MDO1581639.1 mechanosensitive ion channel [Rhizobium oryzicola]